MEKDIKRVFAVAAAAFSIYATTGAYGFSDREGAEKILTDKGYKVVEYKGHPSWGGIKYDRPFYTDAFKVITPEGNQTSVVVAGYNIKSLDR